MGAQESVVMVRDLFRDADTTEFVIATIPTVLGVNESGRLLRALRHDRIPCKRLIVNQARQSDRLCVGAIRLFQGRTIGLHKP